jgi:hypothetical protein
MAYGFKSGGRIKGTTSKEITEIREIFKNILLDNLGQINKDLKELEPGLRIRLLLELSKFVIPQLKSTEITEIQKAEIRPVIINLGSGISPEIEHYPNEHNN